MNLFITLFASVSLLFSDNISHGGPGDPPRKTFLDRSTMDTTISPGDNFFRYANGTWYEKTQIPPSKGGWGSFYVLAEENNEKIRTILESLLKQNAAKGTVAQKVGDFYRSALDTAAMDRLGFEPIKSLLAKIDAAKSPAEILRIMSKEYQNGSGYYLANYVGSDDKNSSKNIVSFYQSGLDLPNKEYYSKQDEKAIKTRASYLHFISELFRLTGTPVKNAKKDAGIVLAFETALAKGHKSPVELRDPVANYNKYAVKDLNSNFPGLNLPALMMEMGYNTDSVLIGQPGYLKSLAEAMTKQSLRAWKLKTKFSIINDAAGKLSYPFRKVNFEFYEKELDGVKVEKERWKIAVEAVDGGLGEPLGQLFVEQYFTPEAKNRMQTLVNNLQDVYRERILKLDWMSQETKDRAIAKLNVFIKKIGYPEKWKDYSTVNISKDTYFANWNSISIRNRKEMMRKLGKPVDKTEWGMTPPTVNAYYNPSYNEIVFPAGILQFPFFDLNADDAINYGAIGGVIGHEMTHGFDDQGRQFDKDGNLTDWWTAEDGEKFNAKAQAIVSQYSGYKMFPDSVSVNGELTLGENIADLGGVTIAYAAFKRTPQGMSTTKIDGFTPDQRFFLSWAQVWRIKNREERMRTRLNTDPHSPEEFRVNGPLCNFAPFYQAFQVKPGQKMYKAENMRTVIW
jgi:putative endopeptidase